MKHSEITLPPDHPAVMDYEAAKRRVARWQNIWHAQTHSGRAAWASRRLREAQIAADEAECALRTAQEAAAQKIDPALLARMP